MGIKYFFAWFRRNFPDKIKSLRFDYKRQEFAHIDAKIDNLMIDLNGIFHSCTQQVYSYGEYKSLLKKSRPPTIKQQNQTFERIWEEILKIVNMVTPKKRIILCIDGVAPMSKQNQQRQRRFRSGQQRNLEEFDSNCITPGTKFMDYLSKALDFKIKQQIQNSDYWKTIDVIFSNEKVPGEGEHKLINFIRFYGLDEESYCIHGMDADLIMLSLATHKDKFHVLRPNHKNRSEIFHINLEKSREELVKTLKWESKEHKFNEQSLIDDFIFMLFSVGNDFLPHLPCMEILENGIEILFEVYQKNCINYGHLTSRNKSNEVFFLQNSFSEFLSILGGYEEDILDKKINSKSSYMTDTILEKNTKIVNGKMKLDFENYKEDYYSKKFGKDYTSIAVKYVEGLQWVLSYYTSGVPSWYWCYPSYYVPFSSDLALIVKDYTHISYTRTTPLLPFQQLLCVLPPTSKDLLPSALQYLISEEKSPISKYYPKQFEVDLEGKRNEWEAIALLPIVDVNEVKNAYNQVIKSVEEADSKRNIIGFSYIYKFDKNCKETYKSYYGELKDCNVKVVKFEI